MNAHTALFLSGLVFGVLSVFGAGITMKRALEWNFVPAAREGMATLLCLGMAIGLLLKAFG